MLLANDVLVWAGAFDAPPNVRLALRFEKTRNILRRKMRFRTDGSQTGQATEFRLLAAESFGGEQACSRSSQAMIEKEAIGGGEMPIAAREVDYKNDLQKI